MEPFVGSMGICEDFLIDCLGLKNTLDDTEIKNIWINDKDYGIACLWTSVLKYPDELKNLVRGFTPSVDAFHYIKNILLTTDYLNRADKDNIVSFGFNKLAIHQISYSGLGTMSGGPLGGKEQKSDYKIDCRWSPEYLIKQIDELHELFSCFKFEEDRCTSYDFQTMIENNFKKYLLYCDPPYYMKGEELYQYSFTEQDHIRLSELLQNTNHVWLLSYDDCPRIRELYDWANIEEVKVNYTINGSNTKQELLISKG